MNTTTIHDRFMLFLIALLLGWCGGCPTAQARPSRHVSIHINWDCAERHSEAAVVIGVLRLTSPADPENKVPASFAIDIESVAFGRIAAGERVELRSVYNHAGSLPPIDQRCLVLLGRTSFGRDVPGPWSVYSNRTDLMPGPDELPYHPIGPETDIVIRELPRIIEIAGLICGRSQSEGLALQREAVWEEWRKGELRRSMTLGWILQLGLYSPGGDRQGTLNFLADLVNDRAMPPECRLMADKSLAEPSNSRPDYSADTPARAALLIELLAHPDLPEHERKNAERTLAELTKRLEAEKKAEAPGKGSPDAQRPD
ncbi:MAG: hypothetical protein IBJ10_08690 [Phycisphaerales bacterium]|nr:hypothetical protein [Phycisphaerales bacterium]